MVHLQSYDGRSPVCRDPLHLEGALFRPLKMLCPRLHSRVEQCNRLPRHGILAVDVCPLAGVTGEPNTLPLKLTTVDLLVSIR
jgi:hypothetical protein